MITTRPQWDNSSLKKTSQVTGHSLNLIKVLKKKKKKDGHRVVGLALKASLGVVDIV